MFATIHIFPLVQADTLDIPGILGMFKETKNIEFSDIHIPLSFTIIK